MNKKLVFQPIIAIIFLSMITKIISMVSRIYMTRSLELEAVSLYSLVNPIFVFAITITSFSLPTAISTLISKYPNKGKSIFLSSLLIAIVFNIIFSLIILFGEKFIAINLLHNIKTLYCVRLLALVVPLTTLSSIIKGYYMGKNELILTSESSLIEECSRLFSTILLIGFFASFEDEIKATLFILVMIIGEIVQTSYLILSSGRKYLINIPKIRDLLKIDKPVMKNVISLSFPLTLSRIITSFTYMIEPILITTILINLGFNNDTITLNYGIISSYVMPLLLFPGFFSNAISNYLLPNISKQISLKHYSNAKKLFYNSLTLSFVIGIIFSLFFLFFGGEIISYIYGIEYGFNEIKILSIPFIIYYIESPINITMHAINKTKIAFKSSLISSIIRIALIVIFAPYLNVFAVAIATLISCYLDVSINYITIHLFFRNNKHPLL